MRSKTIDITQKRIDSLNDVELQEQITDLEHQIDRCNQAIQYCSTRAEAEDLEADIAALEDQLDHLKSIKNLLAL